MQPTSVAIVTTCKGRLSHLKVTLPTWVPQAGCRIVVVDYDCPDGTAAWIAERYPEVKVVPVRDAPRFNASHARNLGAAAAAAEWLVFVDADQQLSRNFVAHLSSRMVSGCFLRPARPTVQGPVRLYHPIVCASTAFAAIGGYDDAIRGWGMEDADLLLRLAQYGLAEELYPASLVSTLPHSESMRVRFYEDDRAFSRTVNVIYAELKRRFRETRAAWLDDAQRHAAYGAVHSAVQAARSAGAGVESFDIPVSGASPGWAMRVARSDIQERLRQEHEELGLALDGERRATSAPADSAAPPAASSSADPRNPDTR
jgi:glycosyltransferase involved in cell wall biosynthesis